MRPVGHKVSPRAALLASCVHVVLQQVTLNGGVGVSSRYSLHPKLHVILPLYIEIQRSQKTRFTRNKKERDIHM